MCICLVCCFSKSGVAFHLCSTPLCAFRRCSRGCGPVGAFWNIGAHLHLSRRKLTPDNTPKRERLVSSETGRFRFGFLR